MPLLELDDVHKAYGHGPDAVRAVRGVDLGVSMGETVGLVGESGCGKSSLARVVVGLRSPSLGEVRFSGDDLHGRISDPAVRRRVQMVFQHPAQSLNRRFRVERTLAEPLRLLGITRERTEIDRRIDEVLELVGLGPEFRKRWPSKMSGGQQQRIAIARALICEPELIVLDEPTSGLDQSVRSRIIALLRTIQDERGVAYLFISHDLSTVRKLADRVAVMYLGRVVELADTRTIFEDAQHPYTQALLSAVPSMDPDARRERITLPGETPSPTDLPDGCSFQSRCPLVHERCRSESPRLRPVTAGHEVECFAITDPPPGLTGSQRRLTDAERIDDKGRT
jgi:oligopeptide/dipeptide ABC transporter ATP-binding protein